MPGEAAANGDYLLPTVFHSVQSDESRHISNGYPIILMALSDERNRELLERDLRYAWWNNHAVVDAAIGMFIEYGTNDRRKDRDSYAEMWRRWIYDDYYRSPRVLFYATAKHGGCVSVVTSRSTASDEARSRLVCGRPQSDRTRFAGHASASGDRPEGQTSPEARIVFGRRVH